MGRQRQNCVYNHFEKKEDGTGKCLVSECDGIVKVSQRQQNFKKYIIATQKYLLFLSWKKIE